MAEGGSTHLELAYVHDHAIVVATVVLWAVDDTGNPQYPWLVTLGIQAHAHDENGLPVEEEQPKLDSFMEPVFHKMNSSESLLFARFTSKGRRVYHYCSPKAEGLEADLKQILAEHPEYHVEFEILHDPSWQFYRERVASLYSFNLLMMRTSTVLKILQEQGDDLKMPRPFNHFAYFPTRDSREQFIQWATSERFECAGFESLPEDPPDMSGLPFKVNFSRTESLDWFFLHGTLFELHTKALSCKGEFDPDGCFAVNDGKHPDSQ